MRVGFFTFLVFGILSLTTTVLAADAGAPIDQKLTREIDVTGDGVPEVIAVHLMAKDFNSPFRWTLTIASKGKVIYSVERDDEWLDELFKESDFVSNCRGYEAYKRKYYFELLPRVIIPKTLYDEEGIMGDRGIGTIWEFGKEYLVSEAHIDDAKAEKIIAAVLKRYRESGLPLLSIAVSPVKSDSPMVYVEEIEGFMPVYRE